MENIIDMNAHYFILMHPLEKQTVAGITITSTSLGSREKWVECEIAKDEKATNDYTIQFRALEEGYGTQTFYTQGIASLLEAGIIIKKEPNMECVEETWAEPLTENAYLRHSGYTLKKKNRD